MPGAVTVLAFAGARDVLGTGEFSLHLDASRGDWSAGAVMDLICERNPEIVPHRPSIRLAVNGCYVDDDEPVVAGDEVALIPPVAGG
jgi:sulfur-carrier protein